MSYCNLWMTSRTREGILEAFRKRRIYGATDNILADFRCGPHFMGEEFSVNAAPVFRVKLAVTDQFAKVSIIRNSEVVYSTAPNQVDVAFEWRDRAAVRGKTSYSYVRGEQKDGELVWISPMWIKYDRNLSGYRGRCKIADHRSFGILRRQHGKAGNRETNPDELVYAHDAIRTCRRVKVNRAVVSSVLCAEH